MGMTKEQYFITCGDWLCIEWILVLDGQPSIFQLKVFISLSCVLTVFVGVTGEGVTRFRHPQMGGSLKLSHVHFNLLTSPPEIYDILVSVTFSKAY